MNATQILDRFYQKYYDCHSYADEGVVKYSHRPEKSFAFQTFFRRPRKFRFEWTEDLKYQSVICSDGTSSSASYSFHENQLEEVGDIHSEIAHLAGVTLGASIKIPPLLLGEQADTPPDRLINLKEVCLVSEEAFQGDMCFVLKASLLHQEDARLWINMSDFSLRKLQEHVVIGGEKAASANSQIERLTSPMKKFWSQFVGERQLAWYAEYVYNRIDFEVEMEDTLFSI